MRISIISSESILKIFSRKLIVVFPSGFLLSTSSIEKLYQKRFSGKLITILYNSSKYFPDK